MSTNSTIKISELPECESIEGLYTIGSVGDTSVKIPIGSELQKVANEVSKEANRAQAVEADLQAQIDAGGGGGEPVDAYTKAETDALLAEKANDDDVVKTDGAQNIDGAKNFRDRLAAGNNLVGRQAYLATGGSNVSPKVFIGAVDGTSSRKNFFGFRLDSNKALSLVDISGGVDGSSVITYGEWNGNSGKGSEISIYSTTMVQGRAVYEWGNAKFYGKADVDAKLASKANANSTVTTDNTQQTITGRKSFKSISVDSLDIPPSVGVYNNVTVSSQRDDIEARLSLRALNKDTASYFQVLSDNATGGNEFFFKACNEILSDPYSDEDTHSEIVEIRPKESNDKETFSGATAKDERTIPTIKAIKGYVEDKLSELSPGGVTDDSVYTAAIQDGAVTTAKLGSNAVTSGKIAGSAVTSSHLAANSVTNSALSADCVGRINMDADSVETRAIQDGAVVTDKIADRSVTNNKLAADVIAEFRLKVEMPIIAQQDGTVYAEVYRDIIIPPGVGGVLIMCPNRSNLANGNSFTIYNYSVVRCDISYKGNSGNLQPQQITRCVFSDGRWNLCYIAGERPLSIAGHLPFN